MGDRRAIGKNGPEYSLDAVTSTSTGRYLSPLRPPRLMLRRLWAFGVKRRPMLRRLLGFGVRGCFVWLARDGVVRFARFGRMWTVMHYRYVSLGKQARQEQHGAGEC